MKGSDRFSTDGISATCRCCGQTYGVMNLSLGGMFLASDSHPHVGESVAVDVLIPGSQPFKVVGVVAWINDAERRQAPSLPTGFGIRVSQMDMAGTLAVISHARQHGEDKISR